MLKAQKRILEEWSGPPLKTRKVAEYYVKCKCGLEIKAFTLKRLAYMFHAHCFFAHGIPWYVNGTTKKALKE